MLLQGTGEELIAEALGTNSPPLSVRPPEQRPVAPPQAQQTTPTNSPGQPQPGPQQTVWVVSPALSKALFRTGSHQSFDGQGLSPHYGVRTSPAGVGTGGVGETPQPQHVFAATTAT